MNETLDRLKDLKKALTEMSDQELNSLVDSLITFEEAELYALLENWIVLEIE